MGDIGPIDHIAVEFPGARPTGEGLAALVDLVDRDVIHILDLRAVTRGEDGGFTELVLGDLDGDGVVDMAMFEGVRSGLLDDDDLAEATELIAPGNTVVLLVYENTWARPLVGAMRNAGAEMIASVRLSGDAVAARLDELDATNQ